PPPMCTCQAFCDIVKSCGGPGDNCMQFCNKVPDDTKNCECKVGPGSCNDLMQCFGMGGTGGGPGGIPQQCSNCINKSADTDCKDELDACSNNPGCVDILSCHDQCGWDPGCQMQCDNNAQGTGDFFGLMSC